MMSAIGRSTTESASASGRADPAIASPPPQAGGPSGAMVLTPQQQAYLVALKSAGIKPSSDLVALSIGSYVCQARAAKQTDQAVWDFVLPLVRSDVRGNSLNAMSPSTGTVNSATADYIRIATQQLC